VYGPSLLTRAMGVLGGLIVVALMARVAWELIAPLLPLLGGLLVLAGIGSYLLRRNHTW
jgi:hypothetical protein